MNIRAMSLIVFALALSHCSSKPRAEEKPASGPHVFRNQGDRADSFMINDTDCSIEFQVATASSGQRIWINDSCAPSRTTRLDDYAALLKSVLGVYPSSSIVDVSSGTFFGKKMWQPEMAKAALASKKWREFQKTRKKTRHAPNKVFVEIFNDADVGADFKEVFRKEGINLRLESVEKVMESQARKLPFAKDHPALRGSKTRVPYSAGVFEFATRTN